MKILARFAAVACVALASAASAQSYEEASVVAYSPAPYASDQGAFTEADLDQMLAPVALYPDELLSQVLMAATYPLEVVQAARWSRAHPEVQGEEAVAAVDGEDWDPSVKSLAAFPNVLAMMNEQLDWTQRLGEAFLAQEPDVTRSVQKLRRAAYDAGNLSSTDEMVVSREGPEIALDSPSPEAVYVPYYDPREVYGPWWWPDAQPVYWAPWPGYYVGGYGFGWSLPIFVGTNFFFGDFDWRRHHVRLHDTRPFYFHGRDRRPIFVRNHEWRHDPYHRRDVPYRNPLVRRDFGDARSPGNVRRDDRIRTRPQAQQPLQQNPMQRAPLQPANPMARPSQPAANAMSRAPQQGFFPAQPAQLARPQQGPLGRESPRVVVPNAGTRPPVYTPQVARPQVAHPSVAMPQQPLARSNVAPQPMPQNPGVRPQVAVPQNQIARPQARPAPAQAQEHPSGPGDSRGDRR